MLPPNHRARSRRWSWPAVGLVVVILAAGAAGAWLATPAPPHRHALQKMVDENGTVYWTCPMHPQVRQAEPGACPICGMKLVRREEPVEARRPEETPLVEIDPRMAQNLGMRTAPVSIGSGANAAGVLVPSEAVIRTGRRDVVLVAEAAGRYRPVAVVLGADVGDDTVVLAGLEVGQQVVVSGQFLIDSEASLRGAYRRMEQDERPAGSIP